MTWIRNPWWDGIFIWSGLPIGLALICLPTQTTYWFFTAAIVMETGHRVAPIVLAWIHREFRQQVMRKSPFWYIVVPIAILVTTSAIGVATSFDLTNYDLTKPHQIFRVTDLRNPFPLLAWAYWTWNIYHFGMQYFGVATLYRLGRNRRARMAICLGVTAFGMGALPMLTHSWWMHYLTIGVFSVNHWLTEIGLCGLASRRRVWFIVTISLLGCTGFLWEKSLSGGIATRPPIWLLPAVFAPAFGIGMVHFLYSRWVWQFSNPEVRATIGKSLGIVA